MRAKLILTASLAFTLAGCGTTGSNTSMYSTNQPVVQRDNYALDVNVEGGGGLSSFEQNRVAEWFEAMKLGFGDRIAVDFGDAYPDAMTKKAVGDLAAKHGMLLGETAPVTAGSVNPGTARVVVTRSKASVPNCPNWSKTTESNFNSSNHPNYGCAVNSNMAAMVADPEDLVRGRESTPENSRGGMRKKAGGTN